MYQCCEDLSRLLVPDSQSAKVLKPGIGSFDDSPVLIPSQFSSILMSGDLVVTTRRDDRFDTALDDQDSKFIAVVGPVRH